jgi:hypothetical protein
MTIYLSNESNIVAEPYLLAEKIPFRAMVSQLQSNHFSQQKRPSRTMVSQLQFNHFSQQKDH